MHKYQHILIFLKDNKVWITALKGPGSSPSWGGYNLKFLSGSTCNKYALVCPFLSSICFGDYWYLKVVIRNHLFHLICWKSDKDFGMHSFHICVPEMDVPLVFKSFVSILMVQKLLRNCILQVLPTNQKYNGTKRIIHLLNGEF